MGSKFKVVGLVAAGAVLGALTTWQIQATARSAFGPLPLEDIQRLTEVFEKIKMGYVEPVDEKKLINDAISGMVSGLDPHSQYFDKKSYKEFREAIEGRFVGVGIEMNMEDGLVKVISPIEGSPAFRAGIKSGDAVTKIDDAPVRGLTMDQAVKKIRGEPATKVTLTIFRKDEGGRTFPVTLTREEIHVQSVVSKEVEPGYAWVRIRQFQERTVDDFARQVEDLYKADPKIKGVVLDLRNDPGGALDGAIGISAAFLPANAVVVKTKGQIQESRQVYRASPEDYLRRPGSNDPLKKLPAALKTVPLVVLINEGSASASEIVAGALQDYRRGVLMGGQSFGKGSVQTVLPLMPGDTALKLTTARYYTPNDRSIQAKGIVPDVWLDETAEGNVYAALRMREADLDKHLANGDEKDAAAREKAREEALKKLEEEKAKHNNQPVRLPEFGTKDDFQLAQALNRLKGQPVLASKTATERKAADATATD